LTTTPGIRKKGWFLIYQVLYLKEVSIIIKE
jgi:hypothetical protein